MFCFMILIQGCANKWVKVSVIDLDKESGKQKFSKSYELNEIKTAYTGQEIVSVRQNAKIVADVQQIDISEKIYVDYAGSRKIEVDAHTYQLKDVILYDEALGFGNIGEVYYLLPTAPNRDDWRWGLLVDSDGNIFERALYCYNSLELWISPTLIVNPNQKLFKQASNKNHGRSVGLYELIYSGKNDVSLNIAYKEYTVNDLARPSYFQNLTYEANAKQIRFRNFVLQIHEATNGKLIYSVLEDGLK